MPELNLAVCPICHASDGLFRRCSEAQGQHYTWYECQACDSALLWLGSNQWAYQKVGQPGKAHLLKQPLTVNDLHALLSQVEATALAAPQEAEQPNTTCPRCGGLNPPANRFCTKCGVSLEVADVSPEIEHPLPRGRSRKPNRLFPVAIVLLAATILLASGLAAYYAIKRGTISQPDRAASPTALPLIDIVKIEELLPTLFSEATRVSASGDELRLIVSTSRLSLFGDTLRGIELADKAELEIYIGTYHILERFGTVGAIVTEIQFDGETAYKVRVTRDQAYEFRPGGILASDNYSSTSADVLAAAARQQTLIAGWEIQYLSPEIAEAIAHPAPSDVVAVVDIWTKSDIKDVSVEQDAASVSLDLSGLADAFSELYGRDSPLAKEEIELEVAIKTVDTMYGLFTRFPGLGVITTKLYIDGNLHSTYNCTRDDFYDIGPETFLVGGAEEDPRATLKLLEDR